MSRVSKELEARFRSDPFSSWLGFHLDEVGPGFARVRAEVRPEVFNFAGAPHGGFLFSLADAAFAAASNSYNQLAVATSVSMQFYRAAELGDTLVAEARENHLTRRAGYYEMTVTTAEGVLVAKCLGVVHRRNRPLVEESPSEPGGVGDGGHPGVR
ncbi:PaaI family thioesterase [Kyrpidia spormannii]|uniref:Thioesterase domain-containing protein n=1 Tax=Kyrpidia spormannii TaxID=2055160 RepID=A0A6F9EAG7_9BACL|nr:hotdog fold thioesterase [Kyrpidia spormannii]CAB3393856.1 conserved protein of unknown function [Kyrpidia spormannii]